MTMDWIVTTGATVEAAVDTALDELSVTQEDIEFEVLRAPKNSLFGFRRNQAQVRARVRPMEPPAKREWRRPTKSDKRKKARKQTRPATKGPSHENGQAREAASIRNRTINTSPQSSNTRSIDGQDESPQSEPPKVRRTRKINH